MGAIAITHMLNDNVWCTHSVWCAPIVWSALIITSGTCSFHPVLLPLLCVCEEDVQEGHGGGGSQGQP